MVSLEITLMEVYLDHEIPKGVIKCFFSKMIIEIENLEASGIGMRIS